MQYKIDLSIYYTVYLLIFLTVDNEDIIQTNTSDLIVYLLLGQNPFHSQHVVICEDHHYGNNKILKIGSKIEKFCLNSPTRNILQHYYKNTIFGFRLENISNIFPVANSDCDKQVYLIFRPTGDLQAGCCQSKMSSLLHFLLLSFTVMSILNCSDFSSAGLLETTHNSLSGRHLRVIWVLIQNLNRPCYS